MFFVFGHPILCGLEVHRPAVFPLMCFTGSVVKDMTGIPVLQASNGNPVNFERLQDFGCGAAILKLFHALVGEQQT